MKREQKWCDHISHDIFRIKMELPINTDASSGQKMEMEGFPLTHQGMLASPTLCNLTEMLISPYTFPLWAGPAQIHMSLTWAALIPLLSWNPLMDSVPTKMLSVNSSLSQLLSLRYHQAREESGKSQLVMAGTEKEFPTTWRVFCSWAFHTAPLCCLSVPSLLHRMGELEGEMRRCRAHTFLTTVLHGEKTILKFLYGISYKSLVQKYSVLHLFNYIFCAADDKNKTYSPSATHRFSSE